MAIKLVRRPSKGLKWRSLATVLCALLVISTAADAVEIHSLLLPRCETETGLIIAIDEKNVSVLRLDSDTVLVPKAEIRGIFVTSTLENPISQIQPNTLNTKALKQIEVGDQTFLGWPVRFIETLAIFYDTRGKTRVHEKESITRIRPVTTKWSAELRGTSLKSGIDLSELSTDCPNLGAPGGLRPNRVMVDQIKVDQYLSDLERGYEDLSAYEERTYLYARPILFEQKTRLTVPFVEKKTEREDFQMPLAIQWGTGRPYGFQSFNQFGGFRAETSPYTEPFPGLRSEVKAHLFHASFTGDIRGLAGGSKVYSEFAKRDSFKSAFEAQFGMNYMLMMGADYENFSLSAGFYYPVHFLRVGEVYREVLANQQAVAVRGQFTTRRIQLYVLGSAYDFSSNAPNDEVYETNGNVLSQLSLSGQLVRFGGKWDFDALTKFSTDAGLNRANYSGRSSPGSEYFKTERWFVSATAHRDFGDYIGASVFGIWTMQESEYSNFYNPAGQPSGPIGRTNKNEFTLGGQIEILL